MIQRIEEGDRIQSKMMFECWVDIERVQIKSVSLHESQTVARVVIAFLVPLLAALHCMLKVNTL